MGDDFLVQKLPSCLFYVSNHNHVLRRFFILLFPLCFPFKLWWFLCKSLFPTVAFYAYSLSSFTAYLSFNFPWYFPEKSGIIYLFFRYVSVNIQWILVALTFLVELSFLFIDYSFIYSLSIRYFVISLSYLFKLFSCLYYLFIYFVSFVFC